MVWHDNADRLVVGEHLPGNNDVFLKEASLITNNTMGLMNVGKGEGAQIIQLFGRGVRLKGCDLSRNILLMFWFKIF